ncbi:MAG TPA: hypothetical protein VFI96_06000 [Longimicrobiaceae bacterium]|nr:hypothetical protein [Longimicrobiaceae bacterium]
MSVNLSERALRQLAPSIVGAPEQVAERLRAAGLEVEEIVPLRDLLEPIVVARVEEVTPHPNADRLRVCVVNDGGEAPLQIVTGAPNVRAGACYPLVRSGVRLPSGRKIKKGKLRGEVSEGMLGSADEMELGSDHDGLMELAGSPAPGTPLVEVLEVEGVVYVLGGNPSEEEVGEALRAEG